MALDMCGIILLDSCWPILYYILWMVDWIVYWNKGYDVTAAGYRESVRYSSAVVQYVVVV